MPMWASWSPPIRCGGPAPTTGSTSRPPCGRSSRGSSPRARTRPGRRRRRWSSQLAPPWSARWDRVQGGGESMVTADLTKRHGELIGGRYRLVDIIGEGGQSVLYRVEDTKDRDMVAIKILK